MATYDFTGNSDGWQCVDGGMDRFVYGIDKYLVDHAETKNSRGEPLGPVISQGFQVKSINPSATDVEKLEVKGKGPNGDFAETFSHVINTAPLSIQRHMDMKGCDLSYKQNQSIRALRYDYSDKVL